MPAILIRVLTWLMTSFAGQVLFSLGLGVISFTSISSLLDWILNAITIHVMNSQQHILIFIELLQLDFGISVLLSAMAIKATIMSAQVALARK